MADLYQFSEKEFLAFFLVLMRISAFVVSWPVFSAPNMPGTLKVLFAFSMTLVIFPVVGWNQVSGSLESTAIILMVLKEVGIGVAMGYLGRLLFFMVSIAGQIISTSMGLSSSQLFNPALGSQSSTIEQFYVALTTIFFLAINGHLIFIGGLVDSFSFLPLSAAGINFESFGSIIPIMSEVMAIGVKICAPVMVSILFLNLAMAVVGRTVPQINVLITSLPVNIMIGFVIMIVSLPLLVGEIDDLLYISVDRMFKFVKTF